MWGMECGAGMRHPATLLGQPSCGILPVNNAQYGGIQTHWVTYVSHHIDVLVCGRHHKFKVTGTVAMKQL